MKAGGLPTLPLPLSCRSSPSGEKPEAPEHAGRNVILTSGFTPLSTSYFSKGCFTLSAYPSVQFTWWKRKRGGRSQDVKKSLFRKRCQGGVTFTKWFVSVEQGHCWLGTEVAHTPTIHARQNHRTRSPPPFAAAATTVTGSLRVASNTVLCSRVGTRLSWPALEQKKDLLWETARKNGFEKLCEGM